MKVLTIRGGGGGGVERKERIGEFQGKGRQGKARERKEGRGYMCGEFWVSML